MPDHILHFLQGVMVFLFIIMTSVTVYWLAMSGTEPDETDLDDDGKTR